MRATAATLLMLVFAGCANTARPQLTIHRYGIGNPGSHEVRFDGSTLVAIEGREPGRVVWTRTLSDAERRFLSERIDQVPLARIDDEYDSGVWDGSAIDFTIERPGRPRHVTSVRNDFVEELADLTDAVDVLLPSEHRFRWREWQAEHEPDAGAPE